MRCTTTRVYHHKFAETVETVVRRVSTSPSSSEEPRGDAENMEERSLRSLPTLVEPSPNIRDETSLELVSILRAHHGDGRVFHATPQVFDGVRASSSKPHLVRNCSRRTMCKDAPAFHATPRASWLRM